MAAYTLALVQMAPGATKEESLAKAADFIAQARAQGARVVCLPELFATPYFCQVLDQANFDLAEPFDGPTVTAMAQTAKANGVTVVAPFYERRAPGVYHNSLAALGPDGSLLGRYRKTHIPEDPGFTEKYYFTPGEEPPRAVPSPVGPLGPLICWDQWFPEAARLAALAGAHTLLYPTAIGWLPGEKDDPSGEGRAFQDAWITSQRAHAIANGVFVAAINRVGTEQSGESAVEFWGSSFVADPLGRVLAQGSENAEELLLAEIDPSQVEATRRVWPFLRDRRLDLYTGLAKRVLD